MSLCSERPNLVYTIAFDAPGSNAHRLMAKMLASSLLKTHFFGDVIIFRNSPISIFRVERKGLEEVFIETPRLSGFEGAKDAWCWKYKIRNLLPLEGYDKILFLDADCLALRNIDHLLEGDWDIAYKEEANSSIRSSQFSAFLTDEEMQTLKRPGINSGQLAIRADRFEDVMTQWENIDRSEPIRHTNCFDQCSWNKLIVNLEKGNGEYPLQSSGEARVRTRKFERGEICFPLLSDCMYTAYEDAALLHCLGADTRKKLRFLFSTYMGTFYFDDELIVLNLLEV